MTPRLSIRPSAWIEINEQIEYMEEQASLETAERFLNNLMQTCEDLSRMPRMGQIYGFKSKSARLLRRWPVKDFENWLIFYVAKSDGIEIIHVIHGARDIVSLLDR